MKNLSDLHTHTVSSGHAYSTLQENVHEASLKGLKYYGMSDHSPKLPGGTHEYHFSNMRVIPQYIEGVRVLKGVELNVMDCEGNVDLTEYDLKVMDYCIASLHIPCFSPKTKEENTMALINVMKNSFVKIIGHPDDGRYPLDYKRLVEAAKQNHVALEINNSSMNPNGYRQNTKENYIEMLKYCKEMNVCVICNSDAHISFSVGNLDNCFNLLKEIDFPETLVINFSEDLIQEYILDSRN